MEPGNTTSLYASANWLNKLIGFGDVSSKSPPPLEMYPFFCSTICCRLYNFFFWQDLQVKSSPPVQSTPPINSDPAIIQACYPAMSWMSYARI